MRLGNKKGILAVDMKDLILTIMLFLAGLGLLIAIPLWKCWWEARKDARAVSSANENLFAVFGPDEAAQKK